MLQSVHFKVFCSCSRDASSLKELLTSNRRLVCVLLYCLLCSRSAVRCKNAIGLKMCFYIISCAFPYSNVAIIVVLKRIVVNVEPLNNSAQLSQVQDLVNVLIKVLYFTVNIRLELLLLMLTSVVSMLCKEVLANASQEQAILVVSAQYNAKPRFRDNLNIVVNAYSS